MSPEMMQGVIQPPDISLLLLGLYLSVGSFAVLIVLTIIAILTLPIFFGALFGSELILYFLDSGWFIAKMTLLTLRGLRRNLLRTSLTYVALFVFTGVLALIYSLIAFLGNFTTEKETDVKVIMTEKFQIPSQMPPRYRDDLKAIMKAGLPPEMRPKPFTAAERAKRGLDPVEFVPGTESEWNQAMRDHFMIWGFVGGSTDPNNKSIENSLFMFALEPHSLLAMMDGLALEDMTPKQHEELKNSIRLMQQDKKNIILGKDRLRLLNKQVGDEIRLYGLNYKDIVFDFRIVGEFPEGRYDTSATMRFDYLLDSLDGYERERKQAHPLAGRCMNLAWARLPDKQSYEVLAGIVNEPSKFSSPAVKMETASAGIGSFLDAFKDIFWGAKYILMPSLAVVMALVVSITMTISVRERATEMAVLKVLGFKPNSVFLMVLSEGLLIGALGGGLCTCVIYFFTMNGVKFPIAFFNTFFPPIQILLYGPLVGMGAAFIGTFLPAWTARGTKASNVFAQVA